MCMEGWKGGRGEVVEKSVYAILSSYMSWDRGLEVGGPLLPRERVVPLRAAVVVNLRQQASVHNKVQRA